MVEQLVADVQPRYRPQDYNLLFNNCNHFTNELGLLLTGEGLPVSRANNNGFYNVSTTCAA
jgi:hypothetical protein